MGFIAEEVAACPVCGSDRQQFVARPDLCQCLDCKLYFRSPRPVYAAILESYESGSTFHEWQHQLAERRVLWEKRLRLIRKYIHGGALLDIGTGDGFFLDFAKRYFTVAATEVSLTGVQYARKRGHEVHHGSLDSFLNHQQQYAVITLWHVLEHVSNPSALLMEVRKRLSPNGIIVIAVPNELPTLISDGVTWMSQRPRKAHNLGAFEFGNEINLTHFTPAVFKSMLTRLHFEIIEFGVDDVHLEQSMYQRGKFQFNRMLNLVFDTHFDTAMFAIVKLKTRNL